MANGPLSAGQPERDAAFDAEIILHELTHCMVQRLVGHGAGISGQQTGGLNEGWADFYSLALLSQSADDANGNYAQGAYFFWLWPGPSSTNGGSGVALQENYYYGHGAYPYSLRMNKSPYTFKDIDQAQASPHTGVPRSPTYRAYPGSPPDPMNPELDPQQFYAMQELWCVTLWEARANLIAKYGFTTGNDLILRLVTDGMKLGPPNPTFGQGRDAILLADRVFSGGANLKLLWSAFAKRGMGWSATFPPAYTPPFFEDLDGYHPVEAFDLPPEGTQMWVYPPAGALSAGVDSSPAVGPDGTIYFSVPYPENKLYALKPDGTFKWSYPGLSGAWSFHSPPAIGPDGTIYVGCYDWRFYALTPGPTAPTLKWTYVTGGQIFASPGSWAGRDDLLRRCG